MGSYKPANAVEITDAVQDAADLARSCREKRAQRAHAKPPEPMASAKQVKRFYAIARANGWAPDEHAELCRRHGFESPEVITRYGYDRICTALENPVVHDECRRGAHAPQ